MQTEPQAGQCRKLLVSSQNKNLVPCGVVESNDKVFCCCCCCCLFLFLFFVVFVDVVVVVVLSVFHR